MIGKLMLFLLSFTFISCKTYKNSEVNSIGIIGSADGPTAIYIKVNPNFLIQKSLDIILEKSEYAVTSNELKNQFDIPIQLFLSCIGYQ